MEDGLTKYSDAGCRKVEPADGWMTTLAVVSKEEKVGAESVAVWWLVLLGYSAEQSLKVELDHWSLN